MSITWSQLQELVEAQMAFDPQRGTLAKRAIAGVEEGLRHLAGVGHSFEIAPRGTLAELTGIKVTAAEPNNDLSIKSTQAMLATAKDPVNTQFEAMTQPQKKES